MQQIKEIPLIHDELFNEASRPRPAVKIWRTSRRARRKVETPGQAARRVRTSGHRLRLERRGQPARRHLDRHDAGEYCSSPTSLTTETRVRRPDRTRNVPRYRSKRVGLDRLGGGSAVVRSLRDQSAGRVRRPGRTVGRVDHGRHGLPTTAAGQPGSGASAHPPGTPGQAVDRPCLDRP